MQLVLAIKLPARSTQQSRTSRTVELSVRASTARDVPGCRARWVNQTLNSLGRPGLLSGCGNLPTWLNSEAGPFNIVGARLSVVVFSNISRRLNSPGTSRTVELSGRPSTAPDVPGC